MDEAAAPQESALSGYGSGMGVRWRDRWHGILEVSGRVAGVSLFVYYWEDITMTELRTRMIEDMKLAGHSQGTQDAYIRVVRQLAGHFRTSPDQLTERQVRDYLMHLREVRKVAKGTFQAQFFGIKFFFVNTLGYDWPLLTKKKSASPTANAFPTFEAMRTAVA